MIRLGMIAAVTAALFAGTGAEAAPRPLPSVGVGVPTWDYSIEDETRGRVLDTYAQAGVRWVRLDVPTVALDEPGFTALIDAAVRDARARGFRILGVLWGGPRPHLADVPSVGWYVERARRAEALWHLDAWEVWNEPDGRLFFHGTPEQYARILRATYPVLSAHGALVLHAGLAHSDPRWLRRSLRAGARFDVLGAHPYPRRVTGDVSGALRQLSALRRVTRKPVWITELGWSTASVSEERQARNTVETLHVLRDRYPYVRRIFFFEARDTVGPNDWLHRLGLLHRDGTPKLAFTRLAHLLNAR